MQITSVKLITNSYYNKTAPAFKGWTPVKNSSKAQIAQMNDVLNNSTINRIAVSGHNFPDSDSIGACFATAYLLNKKTGKPVDVYISGGLPGKYEFLKDDKNINIITSENISQNSIKNAAPYDLAVSVDTSEVSLMDKDYYQNIFKNAKHTFKIDHHREREFTEENKKNYHYADINFTDSSSPSACEMIMQLVKPFSVNPRELPNNFNNAAYIGILGDTGNFSFATSPLPFYDSMLLVKNGLKPEAVMKNLSRAVPKSVTDILSLAQSKIKFTDDNKIGYLFVDDELSKAIKSLKNNDMEFDINNKLKGITGDLRKIEGVEITLLISKRDENNLYFSTRSNDLNVRDFALKYGGNGHDKACGFTVDAGARPQEKIKQIINELQEFYK